MVLKLESGDGTLIFTKSSATESKMVTLYRIGEILQEFDIASEIEEGGLLITESPEEALCDDVLITLNNELQYVFLLLKTPFQEMENASVALTQQRLELVNRLNLHCEPAGFCVKDDFLLASYCLLFHDCLIHAQLMHAIVWFATSYATGILNYDHERLLQNLD
jgi:hypothetical protein